MMSMSIIYDRIKKENNIEQKKFSNNKNKISKTRLNYILNIKTNECHYSRDCENLKNVKTKYLQVDVLYLLDLFHLLLFQNTY